jgi:ribosomal protein S18 acetylase RimI-like enzyme
MAKLGELFIREIGYRINLETGRMKAALYEVDGRPVGFIGYTPFSVTFHRDALRSRWGYATLVLALSILREPRRLLRLPKVMRVMSSRREELKLGDEPLAELVAIGVLPAFRSPDFVRREGLHIAEELVTHAASYFRAMGISRMRCIVDAGNKPALLFYHGLGAILEPYEQAGERAVHVWFDLEHQLFPFPSCLSGFKSLAISG